MDNSGLKIRPFNADDANVFYRWYHLDELKPYFRGFIGGMSLEQCAQAPKYMRAHLLVLTDGTNYNEELYGLASFADTDLITKSYKFGIFVEPGHHNKGIGATFTKKAIQWAFETMNADRVFAELLAANDFLNRAAQKYGFTLEGKKRKSCFFEGQLQDELVYSITREDYQRGLYG